MFRLLRLLAGRRSSRRSLDRGQSVVEFTLVLPVLLLVLLAAIDFGRLYYGWVNLNNAARIAANYAASNPMGPFTSGSQYYTTVTNETAGINCTSLSVPAPTFAPDTGVGSTATVRMTCTFKLISPLIGPIPLSASAVFPIRSGTIAGVPTESTAPCVAPDINVLSYLGMTVKDARAAWIALGGTFNPNNGHDNATVVGQVPLPDTCVSAGALMTVLYK